MDDPSKPSNCFLCLKPADNQCSHCSLPYCSQEHLVLHRPGDYCFPFRIQHNDQVGRFVVATRDVSPLEVVLEDAPAVFGPDHDTVPVCLECLARVDGAFLCPRCSLPLCGQGCLDRQGGFHAAECAILADVPTGVKIKVKFGRESTADGKEAFAPEYNCITPLRLLSKKASDPELWDRLQMLMDHDAERRTEVDYWKMFKRNVVDFLLQRLGLDFSEEEVFRAVGVLRTNAFCVETAAMKAQAVGARAVYPTFSFLSHSCVCNARYSVLPNHHVRLRAQQPIRQGEEITIQYISFMYGHLRRKKDIRACWFFDCACSRCADAAELGSRMSAVRCDDADCDGDVLPRDPMAVTDDWECSQCRKKQSAQSIESLCDGLDAILHDTSGGDVLRYEQLLADFSLRLRPTHYLLMTVKKFLGDLYGLAPGFTYAELSAERMDRKIEYLREFVEVVGKVDPGYTKAREIIQWKGLCLHAVNRPILLKANNAFNKSEISKEEFISTLKVICEELRESLQCLEHEPEGSKEAAVAKIVRSDLAKISDVVLFANFI